MKPWILAKSKQSLDHVRHPPLLLYTRWSLIWEHLFDSRHKRHVHRLSSSLQCRLFPCVHELLILARYRFAAMLAQETKPLPSLDPRWRSLNQNTLDRETTPALQATSAAIFFNGQGNVHFSRVKPWILAKFLKPQSMRSMDYTPTFVVYQMVFNLGTLVRLQTQKIRSSP